MAYLTQAEMVTRLTLPELMRLSRSNPLNVAKVNVAIADAESYVNKFAAGTFGFPWSVVPSQATEAAFTLACVYLVSRSYPGEPLPEALQLDYLRIKEDLKLLRNKKITWVDTNAPEVANLSKAFVSMPNDEPVYSSPRQARLGKLRKLF